MSDPASARVSVTIVAGTPPGWVRFPLATPLRIPPGSVHLMIASGGVRNYGDGEANWWGKEAPYPVVPGLLESGEPPHLQAGAVTVSVYVEYNEHTF